MMMLTRALMVLCVLHVAANVGFAQQKVQERRAVVPNGFIRIFAYEGQVNVTGWDKDSLLVVGTVAMPKGQEFSVSVSPRGAKIGIWGEEEPNSKPSQFTVYLPRRSQVWVKTTGAHINISSMNGGLDLFSVSGSITVSGTPREVYAETMGGEITLNEAKTSSARLKTASGAIKVNGDVSDLTAVTVSGAVNTSMASFGRARLESVDGPVRFYGAIPAASVMDIVNHAGSITLVIPPQTSADFAFNLYEAELNDEFGIKKRWMMSSKFKAKEMTFGLGDRPTARVTIRSFKGPVSIRRLDALK